MATESLLPSGTSASNPPQAPSPSLGLDRLASKIALVTGGASTTGFGAAISRLFAREGAKIVIGDLDAEGAEAMAREVGKGAVGLRMDVSKEEDWKRAVERCVSEFGGLDVVVNNAGTTYRSKPTLTVTEGEFMRVFDVNVKSIYWATQYAIPAIQNGKKGGSMINISSIGSVRPRPGLVWYNSSKGAVSNATKGLAAEFGPDQIRVNAICPLLSATGLFEEFVGVPDTEENRKKFSAAIPLGKVPWRLHFGCRC
ncbi:hypothetical protein MBLNU230_g7362t2 [Neophaeotheca triangularis]